MYSVSRTCWTHCRPSWVSRRCPTSRWWWSTSRASSGTSSPSSTPVIPSPRWAPLLYFIEMCYTLWIMIWVYFDDLWAVVNPEIPGCSVERFRHSARSSGLSHIYALVRSDVDTVERWNLVLYAFMYLLFSFPDLLSALLAENIFYRAYTFSYKLMDWCWHQC